MQEQETKEEWRTIPGYLDHYEVSNLGRFRSWRMQGHAGRDFTRKAKRPKVLKGHALRSGHINVNIRTQDGERRQEYIHRLVMRAFVGPCTEGDVVRHLNDDPGDNRLGNLAYGSHRDNRYDEVHTALRMPVGGVPVWIGKNEVAALRQLHEDTRAPELERLLEKYGESLYRCNALGYKV